MITNDRQFRISRAQLEKLRDAAGSFDFTEAAKRCGSPVLAQAEHAALQSEVEKLTDEIREYEGLRSGAVSILKAQSLSELPKILIMARIAQGLTQRKLADLLGLKEQQVQRYEAEEYSTANVKRLAEVARALNLNVSEVAEIRMAPAATENAESETIQWDRFPIREMYRRNWFEGYTGTLAGAVAQADILVPNLIKRAGGQPRLALHRKRLRVGSAADRYALLAWECRVLAVANSSPRPIRYDPERIDDAWLKKLAQQSRSPDGPSRAKKYLESAGIAVVIEAHLTSTYLDGAALLGERGPVIGLTLRYDRLDNFWFALFHEIMHVRVHLKKGIVEEILDDLEADADATEREADELAARALIPDDLWETALPRYVRTEDAVKAFAREHKISEAIVAGRIRKEADNYVMLAEMVGAGEVRRHFPEVRFGQ
jgi:HTH-type transcriptional regulator/antitoxin HigA